ncbi:MAG: MBOAT family protein [Rudaea sp.]|uniref:MBOAT family O-acyltransferase n=1 Tax=Rudaea sp. TaxID=2136325 RepID=UPI0039E5169B
MLFDTLSYWLFFAAVLLLLAALRPRAGKGLLVVASYAFYACWDVRFVFLLGASTLANWGLGLWIDRGAQASRKRALVAAIVFNLVTLGFFKYFNFFADTLAALLHLDPQTLTLRIVLPVGISFFTFEGIAYAVDVYRRDLAAKRSALDFALFISFFPHLIAGPIIRPTNFFPQAGKPLALGDEDARWGLREILKGLIKKIALSNFYAPLADAYFHAAQWNGASVPAWIGVLAFSMQIYFDFSGYTDIARGCARLLGFRFPSNFERPYLAADIADFWRRWHISLSTWLRDYLYIPLGGNRRGELRTSVNLLIVMGLGGLWHGASWNFAAWGLYHGALLVLHRYWRKLVAACGVADTVDRAALKPFWIALTFLLVTVGWIPFRAPDFATTWHTLQALFDAPDTALARAHPAIVAIPLATLALCLLDARRRVQDWLVERAGFAVVVAVTVVAVIALELFGQVDAQIPFVYFQF